MSLDIALRIATSSLMTTQVQIGVASSNVSNADTTGYTVKTAKQVATVSGGVGTGTTITAITSNVDKLLLKSLMQAISALGAADTGNTYLDQLQALYGSSSGTDARVLRWRTRSPRWRPPSRLCRARQAARHCRPMP